MLLASGGRGQDAAKPPPIHRAAPKRKNNPVPPPPLCYQCPLDKEALSNDLLRQMNV